MQKWITIFLVMIAMLVITAPVDARCSSCPLYLEDTQEPFLIATQPLYARVFIMARVTYRDLTEEEFTVPPQPNYTGNNLTLLGLGTDGLYAHGTGTKEVWRLRGYYEMSGGTGWTISITPPSFTMTAPAGNVFTSVWIEDIHNYFPENSYFHITDTTTLGCYKVQGIGTSQVSFTLIGVAPAGSLCYPIGYVRGWWR